VTAGLTPREREVVGLVTEGRTNAEIREAALDLAGNRAAASGERVLETRRPHADGGGRPAADE
jgi:hypothetical protein